MRQQYWPRQQQRIGDVTETRGTGLAQWDVDCDAMPRRRRRRCCCCYDRGNVTLTSHRPQRRGQPCSWLTFCRLRCLLTQLTTGNTRPGVILRITQSVGSPTCSVFSSVPSATASPAALYSWSYAESVTAQYRRQRLECWVAPSRSLDVYFLDTPLQPPLPVISSTSPPRELILHLRRCGDQSWCS